MHRGIMEAAFGTDRLAEFKAAQGARKALEEFNRITPRLRAARKSEDFDALKSLYMGWLDETASRIRSCEGADHDLRAYWHDMDFTNEFKLEEAVRDSMELLGYLKRPLDSIQV